MARKVVRAMSRQERLERQGKRGAPWMGGGTSILGIS